MTSLFMLYWLRNIAVFRIYLRIPMALIKCHGVVGNSKHLEYQGILRLKEICYSVQMSFLVYLAEVFGKWHRSDLATRTFTDAISKEYISIGELKRFPTSLELASHHRIKGKHLIRRIETVAVSRQYFDITVSVNSIC